MSGSVRTDGLLRCGFGRDSHQTWPRSKPCNRLAVVKYQSEECVIFDFFCEMHARYVPQNEIVMRSPGGFRVLYGKGARMSIVPVNGTSA